MFSGIVEGMSSVLKIEHDGSNMHFLFSTEIADELKVDQSIAHNGVCLTITSLNKDSYSVTAIDETLKLSNLGNLKVGDKVNTERCLRLSDRLDGHIVQGHVDGTGTVKSLEDKDGSWSITIEHQLDHRLILHKGSITVNGVSLTVVSCSDGEFQIAIIPYTYENTNLHTLTMGDLVNLELDILGKYIAKLQA
ncbi:MAG: riboflavin synthase [Bacteroidia bacterium]